MAQGMHLLHDVLGNTLLQKLHSERNVHITLLIMSFVFYTAYMLLLFRPFYKATSHQTKRVVELLSQLPSDMDVRALAIVAWKGI